MNSIKPTALNDAVKFNSKAMNSSIKNYLKGCKMQYDDNQFIIFKPHKAVQFNLNVVN